MRGSICLTIFLLVSASFNGEAQPADIQQPLPADVRLLIDISGSMKKTDPQNLREPAMDLLVQLMPKGSQAGVWTFGQSVNMLVPHRLVDEAWLATASRKSSGINSVALYTHIGAALEHASYDRATLPENYRHNIILLTDGVVDINPEPETNKRERSRILDELLPQLKEAGYVIHTIALSEAADQELMQALSLNTDGVFAVADTADELMSAFLRIFDQAVPAERLPLKGNTFLVDESVKEFTALIFRNPGAAPTVLISPAGATYTASVAGEGVAWHSTGNYDLMTVQKPVAGEWQLKADIDPDNRVTVVSDLQLQIASLVNNLLVGQPLNLQFFFQEENERVIDGAFLRLLEMNAQVTRNNDDTQWQIPLTKRNPPIDGVYQQSLTQFNEAGQYTVRVLIDGKTFQREFKHNVSVLSPFVITMQKEVNEQGVQYIVDVIPDAQLVDPAQTKIEAVIKSSSGFTESQTLALSDQQQWQLRVTPTAPDTSAAPVNYSIELNVIGRRIDGAPFSEELPVQYFAYPEKGDPVNQPIDPPAEPAVPETASEEVITPEATKEPEPEAAAAVPGTNKWLLYSGVVLANVLVFALAFIAYRVLVGKKPDEELDELEQTPEKITDANEKLAMQEVGQSSDVIDVSTDNPSARIAIDNAKANDADDIFLDLGDLDDDSDNSDKNK